MSQDKKLKITFGHYVVTTVVPNKTQGTSLTPPPATTQLTHPHFSLSYCSPFLFLSSFYGDKANRQANTLKVIRCLLYSSSDAVDDVIDGGWKFKMDGVAEGFGILTKINYFFRTADVTP